MSRKKADVSVPELESSAAKMLYKLSGMVKSYSRDVMRVRTLVSFEDRVHGTTVRKKSFVAWNDRPEVELYLQHRNEYWRLEVFIDDLHAAMTKSVKEAGPAVGPNEVAQTADAIARMQSQRQRHLASMESILSSLAKEFGGKEATMAKLAADGAKLAVAVQMHHDRMDLARSKSGTEMSEAEVESIAGGEADDA